METLKHYLPLCWCQANPLELIRSTAFFRQNFIYFFIVQYILQANATDDVIESFFELSLELILTGLFFAFMLYFNNSLHAIVQVLTAILFCANALSVILIPIIVWLTLTESLLSYYSIALLILWYYFLISHIIKKALAINMLASFALAFCYFTVTYVGAFALGQLI